LNYKRLLLLSLASALLSYLGVLLRSAGWPKPLDLILYYLPGLFFGGLVLASMVSESSGVWWRRIRVVIASVLIWHIALRVALDAWPQKLVGIVTCSSAGVLGALLICVASRFIIPRKFSLRQILVASLAGLVGGAPFGMITQGWLPSWGGHFSFISGFIIWQMGVAIALFSGYFLGSETANKAVQPTQGSLNNPA